MGRLRAISIVTGNAPPKTSKEATIEAWQMLRDDGTIWHLRHREGYSLGREAAFLLRWGVIH